ncbi:MAG: YcaO-like family protein [Bacteroidota bacterium]
MLAFHTSLRERPIEETLVFAKEYARKLGITRVTDITRLDSLGIPVYSSIRPGALPGTLCVNSGKGFRPEEALIGAYMEAIEFTMAEYNRAGLQTFWAPLQYVLDGMYRPHAYLDLGPRVGAPVNPMTPIEQVYMEDLSSRQTFAVPAELIFMPYSHPQGLTVYGYSSNGLASGNTLLEATIHALMECIERDALSFYFMLPKVQQVNPDSWPAHVKEVAKQVKDKGMQLAIQYIPNDFGMPTFSAVLIDEQMQDPLYINGGYGSHALREVAMNRAVSEAVQSRLVYIHGGRDDLVENYQNNVKLTPSEKEKRYREMVHNATQAPTQVNVEDINQYEWPAQSASEYLSYLLGLLREKGFPNPLRLVYTRPEESLQVVRTLVPGLEHFNPTYQRLGPRLKAYSTQVPKHG